MRHVLGFLLGLLVAAGVLALLTLRHAEAAAVRLAAGPDGGGLVLLLAAAGLAGLLAAPRRPGPLVTSTCTAGVLLGVVGVAGFVGTVGDYLSAVVDRLPLERLPLTGGVPTVTTGSVPVALGTMLVVLGVFRLVFRGWAPGGAGGRRGRGGGPVDHLDSPFDAPGFPESLRGTQRTRSEWEGY